MNISLGVVVRAHKRLEHAYERFRHGFGQHHAGKLLDASELPHGQKHVETMLDNLNLTCRAATCFNTIMATCQSPTSPKDSATSLTDTRPKGARHRLQKSLASLDVPQQTSNLLELTKEGPLSNDRLCDFLIDIFWSLETPPQLLSCARVSQTLVDFHYCLSCCQTICIALTATD